MFAPRVWDTVVVVIAAAPTENEVEMIYNETVKCTKHQIIFNTILIYQTSSSSQVQYKKYEKKL